MFKYLLILVNLGINTVDKESNNMKENNSQMINISQFGKKVNIGQNGLFLSAIPTVDSKITFQNKQQVSTFEISQHSNKQHMIKLYDTDKVIEKSLSKPDVIQINTVKSTDNQLMMLELDNGRYKIKIKNDTIEVCLTNKDNVLVAEPCTDNNTQRFDIIADNLPPDNINEDFAKILKDDFYLQVDNIPVTKLGNILSFGLESEPIKFTSEKVNDFYRLKTRSGKYLDINNNNITINTSDNKNTNLFRIKSIPGNKIFIIEILNGKCLSKDLDNKIVLSECGDEKMKQDFNFTVESKMPERFYILELTTYKFFSDEPGELVFKDNVDKANKFELIQSDNDNEYLVGI
ncbi:hypothetical protein A0H76_3049, partial [Hepatospora eriocheir]